MANAFIYSLFLVAIFHGCLLIMSFALWKNGYRILGAGVVLRLSVVGALLPIIMSIIKYYW